MLFAMLGFATMLPAQNLAVYDDQLRNGFEDWSWAPRSLTNDSPVHAGKHSISVSAGPWAGLYFNHPEMDTRPYTNLSFWAHGGTTGGQLLRIGAKLGTNDVPGYALPNSLSSNRWERFTVPLDLFGVANKTNFAGLLIQLREGCPTNTFYLDDLEFEVATNAAAFPASGSYRKPPEPLAPATSLPPRIQDPGPSLTIWIAAGVSVTVLLLVWLLVAVKKGARVETTALVPRNGAGLPSSSAPGEGAFEFVSAEDWRQRAIAAEAVASKQAQILRQNLLPEIAEMAKSSLVQGLTSQRNTLIETQRRAQEELAELESRLAALHLPLRERILVYEKRITELEKELSSRGEEMRELIRATLTLVRGRLEEEKRKEILGNGSSRGQGN